jgi:hypothetical protein
MRHRSRIAPLTFAAAGMAAAALAGSVALAAGASAAPLAGGPHRTAVRLDGTSYSFVLGPREGIKWVSPHHAPLAGNTVFVHSSASTGVVAATPHVYLVFWGKQWSTDPAKAEPALQNFFKGLFGADDTWGTILNQYCEGVPKKTTDCGSSGTHISHPTSAPLAGVWMDNAANQPANASAAAVAAEGVKAASHFGNSATANLNAIYVIASPHGTNPGGFNGGGFCAYHDSASTSSDGRVAFTNLPYVPDLGKGACTTLKNPTLLDGYFSTETHEYAESASDIYPSRGWLASSGSEIADECQQLDSTETLTTGTFDVQGLWSNLAKKCVTKGP